MIQYLFINSEAPTPTKPNNQKTLTPFLDLPIRVFSILGVTKKANTMNTIFKVKRLYLVLVLPLIIAMQCEEDDLSSGFETAYTIDNTSSRDLIFFRDGFPQVAINSNSNYQFATELNQVTEPIAPTAASVFSSIKLYEDQEGSFILVYNQDPLNDDVWTLTEPFENKFIYTLNITDALLNE